MAKCKNGYLNFVLTNDGRSYGIDLHKLGNNVIAEGKTDRTISIKFESERLSNSYYPLTGKWALSTISIVVKEMQTFGLDRHR